MGYNKELLALVNHEIPLYNHIWNKWKQINPDTSLQHVNAPWYEMSLGMAGTFQRILTCNKDGLKAALWRKVGGWFNKPQWTKRGEEKVETNDVLVPITKTIHLEAVHYGVPQIGYEFYAYFGYIPEYDTLLVYRR